ncbi:unnamed protein product [Mytilus edulis]|uniref:Fibrinogen C-terminal domain-containing protein n=1 Tax=Mytilus edulis TaxID=6550 RepID=A0A8S3UB50_MYTED|nr:unnamed protein product [Mytilus edulis]
MFGNRLANITIAFIRLFVGVQIYWYYAGTAKIEIEKYRTYRNMKITTSVSPTEVHSSRSHVECSRHLLSKDTVCVASYNTVTHTCMLYTSGCSPSFDVSSTGTLLIRRDLTGYIYDNEDCSYYKNINAPSGVYKIQPEGVSSGMMVYCDMNTGNYNLHTLTYSNKYMLRVDMTDNFGVTRYAEYYICRVSDEADKYRLIIGEYHGNAGDSMYYNNNQIFHTKDQDSTNNGCSLARYAGFWFDECTRANLNGRWLQNNYEQRTYIYDIFLSFTEVHSDRSHMECSRRLLSKDDICVASYNVVTGACLLYASGCSPSFEVSSSGTWLIRRDLSGYIYDNEDCSYYKNINAPSGIFTIQPEDVTTGMMVYCDMDTGSGGWIRGLIRPRAANGYTPTFGPTPVVQPAEAVYQVEVVEEVCQVEVVEERQQAEAVQVVQQAEVVEEVHEPVGTPLSSPVRKIIARERELEELEGEQQPQPDEFVLIRQIPLPLPHIQQKNGIWFQQVIP